ncbi:cation transporter [Streptomyces sp. NPDC052299]|uniref:cation transporter n=1 Tax=Streptomyces sp. NPDC052299 TaxID=3155054 RepID=UPI0034370002
MTAEISISLGPPRPAATCSPAGYGCWSQRRSPINVIEEVVALAAGTLASSTGPIGLDSIIQVSAAVAWQFSARDHAVREAREQRTLHIIAVSFFALAVYVAIDAVRALTGTGEAECSLLGILIAALSLAIMPFLSAAQRRAGRELGSASAVADSGPCCGPTCPPCSRSAWPPRHRRLILADPFAALVIAAIAVKEGRDAWQARACCAPTAHGNTPVPPGEASRTREAASRVAAAVREHLVARSRPRGPVRRY